MTWVISYEPSVDALSESFKTHLNYIKCMVKLTDGLSINVHVRASEPLETNSITKFRNLSRITEISIKGEKDACDKEKAYAQVASPWIPVKCYYRLYYLESIFVYLLNGSRIGFSHNGHSKMRGAILNVLKTKEISFSGTHSAKLATITSWEIANKFKAVTGSTISANYYGTDECNDSLRKKVADYIEIDWRLKNKIISYRANTAKTKKVSELLPREFSLLDYFYWMRVKANYRDVDFLDFDNNVNEEDAFEYLTFYLKAVDNYASALETCIVSLKQSRGMEDL